MPRFHPLRLTQEIDSQVFTEEQAKETPDTQPRLDTSALFVFTNQQQERNTNEFTTVSGVSTIRTTEQLANSATTSGVRNTKQLNVLLSLPPVTSTTGRIVRIPRSRKRKGAYANAEDLPKPSSSLSPRLRHGIVFATILLVMLTTLLYLTPLASGQGRFAFFQSVSDWIHAQQMDWQFQAHRAQVVQNNPQPAAVPPMTLPTSAYVAIARQDAINAGI